MKEHELNNKPMDNTINKKKRPKDDILEIVKQFISYFEETDRSEKDDNSIKYS